MYCGNRSGDLSIYYSVVTTELFALMLVNKLTNYQKYMLESKLARKLLFILFCSQFSSYRDRPDFLQPNFLIDVLIFSIFIFLFCLRLYLFYIITFTYFGYSLFYWGRVQKSIKNTVALIQSITLTRETKFRVFWHKKYSGFDTKHYTRQTKFRVFWHEKYSKKPKNILNFHEWNRSQPLHTTFSKL